jgi:hypothetical protein
MPLEILYTDGQGNVKATPLTAREMQKLAAQTDAIRGLFALEEAQLDQRSRGAATTNAKQRAKAANLKARVQAAWRAAVAARPKKKIVQVVAEVCEDVGCSEPTAYKYRPDKPRKKSTKNR